MLLVLLLQVDGEILVRHGITAVLECVKDAFSYTPNHLGMEIDDRGTVCELLNSFDDFTNSERIPDITLDSLVEFIGRSAERFLYVFYLITRLPTEKV